MKIGFELFKTRALEEKLDIERLEKENKIYLPPLYKLFINSFHTELYIDEYLDPKLKQKRRCYTFNTYPYNNDFEVEEIMSIDVAFDIWKEYFSDHPQKNEFFCFAVIGVNEVLAVGLKGEKKDQIFRSVGEREEFEQIGTNIFEFIRGLRLEELNKFYNGYQYSQFYKNWGEGFWRIREEKEES